jgi:hypothetical protein
MHNWGAAMPLLDYEDEVIDGKMAPVPKAPPRRMARWWLIFLLAFLIGGIWWIFSNV